VFKSLEGSKFVCTDTKEQETSKTQNQKQTMNISNLDFHRQPLTNPQSYITNREGFHEIRIFTEYAHNAIKFS
jgi:hypothetical protein